MKVSLGIFGFFSSFSDQWTDGEEDNSYLCTPARNQCRGSPECSSLIAGRGCVLIEAAHSKCTGGIFLTPKLISEEKEVPLCCCGWITFCYVRNPRMTNFVVWGVGCDFFFCLFAFSSSVLIGWKWHGGFSVKMTSWDLCVLKGHELGNSLWSSSC